MATSDQLLTAINSIKTAIDESKAEVILLKEELKTIQEKYTSELSTDPEEIANLQKVVNQMVHGLNGLVGFTLPVTTPPEPIVENPKVIK